MTDTPTGRTGLAHLQAMIADPTSNAPMVLHLGFQLTEAEPGRAVFSGVARANTYNPHGSVHGGWYGALLDSAMSCAIYSMLPAGRAQTTIEYKINILRPATEATGLLHGIGEAVRVGRRVGAAEGRVVDAAGKVYATGSTNGLIIEL